MAAAEVAAELGIPVVFTVAPDPQALLAAREADGTLPRAAFGAVDSVEHFWFRARLVHRLAEQAEHLVLFPRPDVEREHLPLVGIDVSTDPERVTVVGEGVDVVGVDRVARRSGATRREARSPPRRSPTSTASSRSLPRSADRCRSRCRSAGCRRSRGWRRSSRPGWATRRCDDGATCWSSAATWTTRARTRRPSSSRIRDLVAADESGGAGLLLAGHRPNARRRAWLAAAQQGWPGRAAPGGVYVCGSLKEEFGIAMLEAMAAGLVVVAPDGGGPATYVDDGVTGILTDPAQRRRLAARRGPGARPRDVAGSHARSRRSRAWCANASPSTRWRPRSPRSTPTSRRRTSAPTGRIAATP